MIKKIVLIAALVFLAAGLWGQSNELLDRFLDRDEADVATTMLLIAQVSGSLPLDTDVDAGYAWAVEQEFGKYVSEAAPDDPVSLGLFYLAFENERLGPLTTSDGLRVFAFLLNFLTGPFQTQPKNWPGRSGTYQRIFTKKGITSMSTK